jgi:hypothetical protein
VTRTIYRERIPSWDPRLRRHVLHDSESRRYAFDTTGLRIASVDHDRILPILDQGEVGSCTADCGFGVLGTAPYTSAAALTAVVEAFGSFDQAGAYRLYSAEELADGDGPYPPYDNGSTGLTLAKTLRAAGTISGWTQTFTLDDALKALAQYPLAIGTYWYNSMFTPLSDGVVQVHASSGVAGGHEYEAVGYDDTRGLVKLANSWGTSWGRGGYFFLAAEDLGTLLDQQGDVTIFTPLDQPAPTPTPAPDDPYATWAATARPWAAGHHSSIGGNSHMAKVTRAYIAAVEAGG